MQKLAVENEQLASSHVSLRKELAAAQQELQRLQAQWEAARVAEEQEMRGFLDKSAKVEAVMGSDINSVLERLAQLMTAKAAEGSSPGGGGIGVSQADPAFKFELMPNDVKLNGCGGYWNAPRENVVASAEGMQPAGGQEITTSYTNFVNTNEGNIEHASMAVHKQKSEWVLDSGASQHVAGGKTGACTSSRTKDNPNNLAFCSLGA